MGKLYKKGPGEYIVEENGERIPVKKFKHDETGQLYLVNMNTNQKFLWDGDNKNIPTMAAEIPLSDVASGFLANLGKSAWVEINHVISAIVNIDDTMVALGNLAQGAVRMAVPGGDHPSEAMTRSVIDHYKTQYGTLEGFKRALRDRPAEVLSDLSIPLSGGATILTKLASAGGKAAKFAEVLSKVAPLLDPTVLAAQTGAKLLKGTSSMAADAQRLTNKGINLTIGQRFGGIIKDFEDRLAGIPLVGSFIHKAQAKTIAEFNRAAYNTALEHIGKNADGFEVGRAGVERVRNLLSAEYKRILPEMSTPITAELMQQIDDILAASELPARTLKKIKRDMAKLSHGLEAGAHIDGVRLKKIMSDFGVIERKLGKSSTYAERSAGDAIAEVNSLLADAERKANPANAAKKAKVDQGWKAYVIINKASTSKAANDPTKGISPSMLDDAVKWFDDSPRKMAFGEGRAYMQDLTSDALRVLPNKGADSGTAGRLMLGSALASGTIHPGIVATGAAVTAPYISRRATNAVIANRPDVVKNVGEFIGKINPMMTQPLMRMGRAQGLLEEEPH